jgi:catalase
VRCHWTPHDGVKQRPPEELAALSREVLLDAFDEQIAQGPVGFDLVLELAQPGDPLDDVTALWPVRRARLRLRTARR